MKSSINIICSNVKIIAAERLEQSSMFGRSRTAVLAVVGLAALAVSTVGAQAQTTFTYNFGTTSPGTAAPTSGSSSNVTAGSFSIGNSLGTVSAPLSNTSPSNYTGASGSYNLGNAVKTGAFSASTSSYYALTLNPVSGDAVSLTSFNFGARSTGTGPTTYALYSSLDSYATPIFADALANDSTWRLLTNNFSFTGTTDTAITFRLYTYGGTGNAANNTINSRIDDVSFIADGVVVPEPATVIGGLLLVSALAWNQRRRLAGLLWINVAA